MAQPDENLNRNEFYRVFSGSDSVLMGHWVQKLEQKTGADTKAFAGALKMKYSQFLNSPSKKLSLFKEGKMLLEAAIKENPLVPEYRFLRIAIQERAPSVVRYKQYVEEDFRMLKDHKNNLKKETINAIRDYAEKFETILDAF